MSYAMLPAMLNFSKYVWLMFYFYNVYRLLHFHLLRPRTNTEYANHGLRNHAMIYNNF